MRCSVIRPHVCGSKKLRDPMIRATVRAGLEKGVHRSDGQTYSVEMRLVVAPITFELHTLRWECRRVHLGGPCVKAR
jgi:hypothetical protein